MAAIPSTPRVKRLIWVLGKERSPNWSRSRNNERQLDLRKYETTVTDAENQFLEKLVFGVCHGRLVLSQIKLAFVVSRSGPIRASLFSQHPNQPLYPWRRWDGGHASDSIRSSLRFGA